MIKNSTYLLVIDIGNTDATFGIFDGEILLHNFRIKSLKDENYVYFEYRFRQYFLENNLRFIKLVFPVKATTKWNGNVYIPALTAGLDELKWYYDWDYAYSHINEDFNNGIMNFPNSVLISYEKLTNDSINNAQYSNYTNYKEAYARNVGLIYRELTHWEYQPTVGYRSGFSVVMRAKKYN